MLTSMAYLNRQAVFEHEKPFDTDFPVDHIEGARTTNHAVNKCDVNVHAISNPEEWDLNVHGFCILQAHTHLQAQDAFTRKREVQKDYWYELEALLHEKFPEYSRIESYDCTLRKRAPDFPEKVLLYTDYEQPATRPHCDCSHKGAFMELAHVFPHQASFFEDKDFDILVVWRPLKGPSSDWPLALCDWTSIEENDIRLNDAIRRDRVDENSLLHHNPKHRWYYIPQQTTDDMFVFRNTDSMAKRPRGFHCSVMNTDAVGPLRESVEVRLVAIR